MPTLAELEAKLSYLDLRRDATLALIEAMRTYESLEPNFSNPGDVVVRPYLQPKIGRTRAAPIMAATEKAAEELMERTGKPVKTTEVIAHLRELDLPVPVHNAANVVSARLSNSKRIQGKRGRGWWFSHKPWPDDEILFGESDDGAARDTAIPTQLDAS